MIELKEIHKSYSTKFETLHVLKGINLSVERGEFISIMGASGSGKSTLLNILGLLDRFDDGEYLINGTSVKELTEDEMAHCRNKNIGFVFQSANLIPQMDILDNIILPLTYRKMAERKMLEQGLEMLERFGLLNWKTHYPNEISGGQRQRVAIARALITSPDIILADEPTGQLDSSNTLAIMNMLSDINKEYGSTMIIVTHEMAVAEMTDRVIRIKDGMIC